jgi:hypothetical protein
MKITTAAEEFLAKALGSEGLEELQKFELYKINSNKVLDHHEIGTAMQIVPRAVLSLLHRELSEIPYGGNKEIVLPMGSGAVLSVTKHDMDLYSGDIHDKGKFLAKFKDRSLPGVGLVVMSTFELYDIKDLSNIGPVEKTPEIDKIQQVIDERLGMRDLIRQVVDQRLTEREAIDSMIRMRLTQAIKESAESKETVHPETESKDPKRLKQFLDNRKKKRTEFKVSMAKNETVSCQDCGQDVFIKGAFSGCVCYGEDMNNKIYIKKSEDGVTMRFPKSWDVENISMLLETMRNKNRGQK